MDRSRFSRLCAGVEQLTVGQVRELWQRLGDLDARIEILARIDAHGQAVERCVHCGGQDLQHWGETGSGLRRWRCKGCARTFCASTGTVLAEVRKLEKLQLVVADMLAPVPSSCRQLANRLSVDRMTVWRWRHRILKALIGVGASSLRGIVEADETFFRESRKGSREWVQHERKPALFPAPPRPRWQDFRRLGLLRPTGTSRWHIPVLTLTDRAGARRADRLPDRRAERIEAVLGRHVSLDAVLCSDGDDAYGRFAREHALPHYRLHPKQGPKVIDQAFHLQTVNNLHSRLKAFMRPFCGPATKNLQRYLAWFLAKTGPSQEIDLQQAWNRLLQPAPT